MVWQKIDDQFGGSAKVVKIPRSKRFAAIGLWTLAGNYACRALTDGVLQAWELEELGARKSDADELIRVELWHAHGHSCPRCAPVASGAVVIHDFLLYNPSRAKVEAEREAERVRKAAQRDKKRSPGGTPGGTPRGRDAASEQPVPVPSPSPINQDTSTSSHLPERASSDGQTDVESARRAVLAGLGIRDFGKVKAEIVKATRRDVSDEQATVIVADILSKATDTPRSPQAYVLGSIRQSWAELQQSLDEAVVS